MLTVSNQDGVDQLTILMLRRECLDGRLGALLEEAAGRRRVSTLSAPVQRRHAAPSLPVYCASITTSSHTDDGQATSTAIAAVRS